jgi:hypothetical protein
MRSTETLIAQTSWSKALVRNEVDPRMALAVVLGLPAGDIQVRQGPGVGLDPPATANTVPSPRPNNPSPNTALAAQPSNAEPGSPSGDN